MFAYRDKEKLQAHNTSKFIYNSLLLCHKPGILLYTPHSTIHSILSIQVLIRTSASEFQQGDSRAQS